MSSKTASFAALVCALLGCTDAPVDAPTPPWGGSAAPCGVGEVRCGQYCHDLRSELLNCGACGHACSGGMVCSNGACRCPPGGEVCGDMCADLRTSARHCGACGSECGAGEACVDGACRCPAGSLRCGETCVDPRTNVAHCGACGRACADGTVCAWGRCEVPCVEGMARCGRAVCDVNLQGSPDHCGACDHPCRGRTTCRDGWCAGDVWGPGGNSEQPYEHPIACDPMGWPTSCPLVPNGTPRCSAEGRCVFLCPAGAGNCDGSSATGCETSLTTITHCGACGYACRPGQHCGPLGCRCPSGQTLCGDRCVDQQDDRAHCGGCGVACAALEDCVAGRCAPREALRLLSPPSGGVMATRRPTLRWFPGRGEVRATVELCHDRACARPIATLDATGGAATVTSALAPGVVFWRVRGRRADGAAGEASATWAFRVGAREGAGGGLIGHFVDVDGDGLADFVRHDAGTGRVCVHRGARAGLSEGACTALRDPAGWDVQITRAFGCGDFDGDGFTDVAVGATGGGAGRVFVLRGGAAGLTRGGSFDVPGAAAGAREFATLYGVGDLDGDGRADLAVGQSREQMSVVVVRAGGPDGSRWPERQVFRSQHGESPSFGAAVVNAGDLDGDGYGDLVITSPGTLGWGLVYVHPGGPTRLLGLPAPTLTTPPGAMPYFGGGPVTVGDVNDDGFADLGIAASMRLGIYPGTTAGVDPMPADGHDFVASLQQGATTFAGASDFNGDGASDVLILMQSLRPWVISGGRSGLVWSSRSEVPSKGTAAPVTFHRVGDLNGDGCDDVVAETAFELTVHLGGARSPSLAIAQRIPIGAEPL